MLKSFASSASVLSFASFQPLVSFVTENAKPEERFAGLQKMQRIRLYAFSILSQSGRLLRKTFTTLP
jgi:hypothetical protein